MMPCGQPVAAPGRFSVKRNSSNVTWAAKACWRAWGGEWYRRAGPGRGEYRLARAGGGARRARYSEDGPGRAVPGGGGGGLRRARPGGKCGHLPVQNMLQKSAHSPSEHRYC
jgi:hypothetical protein